MKNQATNYQTKLSNTYLYICRDARCIFAVFMWQVYDTNNYFIYGLCPPSSVQSNTAFRKLDISA